MYVIDADTHISPQGLSLLNDAVPLQAEGLIAEMDRAGVARSVAWLQPPYMRELDSSLDYIRKSVEQYPDRLLGFGWANPRLGVEQSIETVRTCIDDYHFHGVKLNGAQDCYYIDDERHAVPVAAEIARLGGMICYHVGVDAYEFTHPYRVAKVARRFPETTFLLAHMGGVGSPDMSAACVEMAAQCPNIYLIGSSIGYNAVLGAIKRLGAERVCYGSDYPFNSMRACAAGFKALLTGEIGPADIELVMGGNIRRLFGLS